jgi:hypothetical protein
MTNPKIDAVLEALKTCQRRLRQLKAGRQLVDQAEGTFSELADTVERVVEERRKLADRRRERRATPERRRNATRHG